MNTYGIYQDREKQNGSQTQAMTRIRITLQNVENKMTITNS